MSSPHPVAAACPSTAHLAALLAQQRHAWQADPCPDWPTRAARLRRLATLLHTHGQALHAAIDADFGGRPRMETELGEIWPTLEELKHALRHGAGWMRTRRAAVGLWFLPARAEIQPRPLGVVGIVVPWNYPLFLALAPLVGALAAGNRVMLKLPEATPRLSALLQQRLAEHFAEDEVAAVCGGPTVGAAFCAQPFDHLLFTGSTAVGRQVAQAAAAQLTPVTLELGGKSPAVLAPGQDLAHAARRILNGKLFNAGQTCVAPDYVLLHRAELEPFLSALRHEAQRRHPQGLADADYASLIHTRHHQRLCGWLDEVRAAGGRIEPLWPGPVQDDVRHRLAPQALVDPPPGCAVREEEIFGPLLPLLTYERLEEAVAYIQARPRPLALYWFDRDRRRTDAALRQLLAGGVTVNDTFMHLAQHSLPFGGVGASGQGHYHGRWGFEAFSKLLPVFRQARLNAAGWFLPPYRPLAWRLLALMKRL